MPYIKNNSKLLYICPTFNPLLPISPSQISQEIEVHDLCANEEGWWCGKSVVTDAEGMFPSNAVEVIEGREIDSALITGNLHQSPPLTTFFP